MPSNNGYNGQQTATSSGSDFNTQSFMAWSILARVRTMQMVKVMGVTNAGGISPVGFVDLLLLVNQVDGAGNAVPHGTIYHCPYFRLQGGANAIIIDPQVGDIGWAGFADRDISSVIANKGQANPGSRRMFNMADAVYFGGMLNGTPTQYIAFSSSGIAMVSPTKITLQAPLIEADASTSFTINSPTSTFSGAVTVQGVFEFVAGMIGSAASGAAAVFTGILNVVGQITANGKRVDDTHTHTSENPGTPTSTVL